MEDKPVPEITIKLYPWTLMGIALAGAIVLSSVGSWWLYWQQLSRAPQATSAEHLDPGPVATATSTAASEHSPGSSEAIAIHHFPQPPQTVDQTNLKADPPEGQSSELEDRGIWSPSFPAPQHQEHLELALETAPQPPLQGTVAYTTLQAGTLRVGNQTAHPIRVALLQRSQSQRSEMQQSETQQSETQQETQQSETQQETQQLETQQVETQQVETQQESQRSQTSLPISQTPEPIHWDFAPGEGRYQGLILSLGTGDLYLSAGDIVVVFAQDGSQQYWGPYVVGETSLPYWNSRSEEWQLLIQELGGE